MSKSKIVSQILAIVVAAPAFAWGWTQTISAARAAEAAGPEATRCDTFNSSGTTYFALSLPPTPATAMKAHNLVLLVDTSAGQAGTFRDKALEIVGSLLASAGEQDHVLLMAVDVNAVLLTQGFVAPRGAEIDAAMAKLQRRVPLGATDMGIALDKAIESLAGSSAAQSCVVYIGDGSSKANAMVTEYNGLVDRLVKNHVSVSSYAIGPEIDASLLAALANQTGGMLVVDNEQLLAKVAGQHLLQLAEGAVIWPTATKFSKNVAEVYPNRTPPLRADRDTILLGKLTDAKPFDVRLTADAAGKPVELSWTVEPRKSDDDNAYFAQLVDAARADGGYRLPTVGSDGLWEVRRLVHLGAQNLAKLGSQAASSGNVQQARQLTDEALRRDPNNARAQQVKKQLDGNKSPFRQIAAGEGETVTAPSPGAPPPAEPPVPPTPTPAAGDDSLRLVGPPAPNPPPAPGDQAGAMLQKSDRDSQILRQIMVAEVNRELDRSRSMVATDPASVKQDLTLLLERVDRAPELSADTRAQLREQIQNAIQLAQNRIVILDTEQAEMHRKEAEAKENLRIQGNIVRTQQKVSQLIERMDSLLDEGRYAEAEEAAADAKSALPNNPVTEASHYEARLDMWVALDAINRDLRQKEYLETMHLVDVSAIAFPDDPPIVYPSAEQWRALTKARAKYKSVDLKETGSAEEKILKALDDPTNMEFVDTPLKDVVDQLKLQHGIEIQLDHKALAEASIPEDKPISASLKGISLRSALRLVLAANDLNYIIDHEVLLITTAEKAKTQVVTKVYPVADLVLPIAIPSGLNPFQSGGGLGGNSSLNSGMGGMGMGTMGGGGFGGGGFGGGGGGGGGGFGGGGAFDVADPAPAPAAAAPSAAAPVPATPPKAAVKPVAGKAEPIALAHGSSDVEAAWNDYFAKLTIPQADNQDPSAVAQREAFVRQQNASVRETVRHLMNGQKFGEVTSLIRGALRNGWGQPWMYEALGLAMQADNQPKEEIERALMSAVAFAHTNNDLMFIAAYLSHEGFDRRALKLYEQASQLEPARFEPYMHGLELALRLGDVPGIQWACVGVLGQNWTTDKLTVPQLARRAAESTLADLRKNHRTAEAEQFEKAINAALLRDCVVIASWNGDAEVDMAVEEPAGTVCSLRNPRTTSGGTLLTGAAGRMSPADEGTSQAYVVTHGFTGSYRMLLRRVWGKPSAGKVTVDIYSHYGAKNGTHLRQQIAVGEKDALVTFELADGRRQESLAQAQAANAAQTMLGVNQAILAQIVGNQVAGNAAPANAAGPNAATTTTSSANSVAAQLAQISDPGALQSLYYSRTGVTPDPNKGDLIVGNGLLPFAVNGAVGYQPVITTLPEGTNLAATAVISADRRYVRISAVPLFSSIGNITTFNFATGAQSVQGGGSGQLGGGPSSGGFQ